MWVSSVYNFDFNCMMEPHILTELYSIVLMSVKNVGFIVLFFYSS